MGVTSAGRVLTAGLVWRSLSVASAGRTLARTLVEGSEQERTMAGMALVQAGSRSVEVIEGSVVRFGASAVTVHVLADIGGDRAQDVLGRIAAGSGPVAELAAEILAGPGATH